MFKNDIDRLLKGDSNLLFDPNFKIKVNNQVSKLLSKYNYTEEEYEIIGQLLHIGNIVYNNTDLDDFNQIIDNDSYDILLERYKMYNPNFQVGAEPVQFNCINQSTNNIDVKPFISRFQIPDEDNFIYKEDIFDPSYPKVLRPFIEYDGKVTGKKYRIISHGNPNLVGSLDKCKYVLNSQSIEKGNFDDPSVKVLERDFFEDHFRRGLINREMTLRMMLEFKYDGVSIVVTIKNKRVIAAVSRGDTGMDKAVDYTPIFYGYYFSNLPDNIELDVKCEAVMTYTDLFYYNQERGKDYKNCRSAIVGLLSCNDGALYQRYITLVPLAVAHSSESGLGEELDDIDRVTEVAFINKYLVTKEYLRASYIEGTYDEVLFLIKRFVDEAEMIRPLMPTMYDGVVLSYVDQDIRNALGRENFINKYSIAIKFNTMKKLTTLLAITYTIGQDGTVTPMAHYSPITFLGTVHTKSSIASLARFNDNKFKIGNIIEVEYRNDVMPYVSTPMVDHNRDNPNPILEFISVCPECGTELVISSSGKSAKCPNIKCKGRSVARMANMMDKLGLKDFAEAAMEKIGKYHLTDIIDINKDSIVDILGEVNSEKFVERMNAIKTNQIYDFEIVGALGFSGTAQETWKKIFCNMTLKDFYECYKKGVLETALHSIKGIGPMTTNTIIEEMEYFEKDILYILNMNNIKSSIGLKQKTIRVTGFRDPELMEILKQMGYDASDKGVTKTTDILLIPNSEFTSSKLNKIGVNTLVVPVSDFRDNMEYYLSQI